MITEFSHKDVKFIFPMSSKQVKLIKQHVFVQTDLSVLRLIRFLQNNFIIARMLYTAVVIFSCDLLRIQHLLTRLLNVRRKFKSVSKKLCHKGDQNYFISQTVFMKWFCLFPLLALLASNIQITSLIALVQFANLLFF